MMNIIKTAIVTIIISIISGLLVERFKNLAPRILCNIGKGTPIKLNNKKVYAYKVTVSNLSKKIVHELSLNIQSAQSSIKIADAKITKGLKFDSSAKDNILDIFIPFLSKDDKFSVTVYVENYKKPTIVLHSPENFKEIDNVEKQGGLSTLFNKSKNKNEPTSNIMKKIQSVLSNKKAIIAAVSIVLVVIVGILVKSYFNSTSPNTAQTSSTGANANKSNANAKKSSSGNNKSSGARTTAGDTNRNTSTGGASTNGKNTSTNGTSGNTGANTSTGGTNTNSGTNTSTSGTDKNTNTKGTTAGSASGGGDTKPSTNGSTNTKTSTDGSAGSGSTSTGGTTENANK